MGRRASEEDADRYLVGKGGQSDRTGKPGKVHWHYKRKVPANVVDLDDRAPVVRLSLKTDDLAEARRKRDALELADNELWASFLVGSDAEVAVRRHKAAVRRAEAMGFGYRPIER